MVAITDQQDISIVVTTGVSSERNRTETRAPRRVVTINAQDIPGMPEKLAENGGHRRALTFAPETVQITYRLNADEVFGLADVVVTGPNIRKDGSRGDLFGRSTYWFMPDGKVVWGFGKYTIPDYLAPLVTQYDPLGSDYPFTATSSEPGGN